MVNMKRTILLAVIVLISGLRAEEYWVQVFSGPGGSRPDASLLQRVQGWHYAYAVHEAAGKVQLRIGAYPSRDAAEEALSGIRCKIASDAFIVSDASADPVPERAAAIAVETVPDALAVIRPERTAAVAPRSDAPAPVSGLPTPASSSVLPETVPQNVRLSASDAAAPELMGGAAASFFDALPSAAPCVCICDKHARRKAEIAAAISFYKNSPDYRFVSEE